MSVVVRLGDLPPTLRKINIGLVGLSRGHVLDQQSAIELGFQVTDLYLFLGSLGRLLRQVAEEAETG